MSVVSYICLYYYLRAVAVSGGVGRAIPNGDTTIPSCEVFISATVTTSDCMLDKHHCLRIVGQREDVFRQLHSVVAGVERAADAAIGGVDRQEIPPIIDFRLCARRK